MTLNYKFQKIGDDYIFTTEILNKKIERVFKKESFLHHHKESELGILMLRAFKTYILTTIRDDIKLKKIG